MSYKIYENYKNSGIDWIGEVPEHWEKSKIKFETVINKKALSDNFPSDSEINYIDIGSVNTDGKIENFQVIQFENAPSRARRIVDVGDTIVSTVRTYLKAIAFIDEVSSNLICSTGFATLSPKRRLLPKYLFFLMRSDSYVNEIVKRSTGVSYPAVNASDVGKLDCLIPDEHTQGKIINFLDLKSFEIDSMISDKEKLIELLQEKRQATISEAVTKGLNPDVKRKDSGIEWIGEIPEHWDIISFKRLTEKVIVGIAESTTDSYVDSGIPIVRSTNVKNSTILTTSILYIDIELAEKNKSRYLHEGDLLTVRTGNAGVTAVVPKELNNSQCFTMLISSLKDNVSPFYYCYFINSNIGNSYFDITAWGTAQKNISVPILQEMPVVIPPFKEQIKIVEWLNKKTQELDNLTNIINNQIAKLKEYRQSLISEAVTGKIDVRDYAQN